LIDELDRKLISELQKNRYSRYSKVAEELGISRSTVSRRINRLIKEKIIRIIGVPDIRILGENASAFIALKVEVKRIDDICQELSVFPSVFTITQVYGRWDILLSVLFPTVAELREFIKKELANITGINQIETLFVAETKKLTFGWVSTGNGFNQKSGDA